jgi:TP901 family phage tail tape measure protein
MADVNANIGVHIDTSAALTELKNLQRQLATFHGSIAKGSAASAMAQKNLQTNLLNSINATGKFTAQMGLVRTSTESFTHALEKNKLGMRDYYRYAGASTKTFGRLFKQEFDTINKVAEDRVKKMQTQYIKMGRDASGAMKAMAITPTSLNMKDYATQTAMAAQKQALFNQLVRQGSTNLLNFGKNTQWAGRQLMVGFTIPLAMLGTTAAKTFMDLEAQALKFRRVYGDMFTTTEETNKALADVEALAEGFTKYGVEVAKTMEMAASAAAMGQKGAELSAQVAQATRLAVLGGVEQQQALETTISLTSAFGVAAADLTKKIDFLNSVENQTIVSIEDLTIAVPKAGPVVKQLGGDVEDLAFFLTAMKEGGINASEGANALKSGLASLINPSEKASKFLEDLGINIKSIVEGNQGDITKTVIDFSRALDTLDPLNRSRAIEQLFGKFQFSRLSTLFQNVTKEGTQASKVLDLAGKSIEELAILSERELKAIEDSIGTNFKSAVEELRLALAPIGKTFLETVTPIVRFVGDLLERFNNLSDGTKKFIVVGTALVGLIGPVLLMTFGLLANGVANIIKLFLSLRVGFLKLTGNSKILAEQTNYLNSEQLESATVAASLNQAHTTLTQSFTAEASAVRALRQAYIDATIAATNFARANPGMMMPGKGKNPKKFAKGTTYVPGTGNKDTVPSVLTPGEAVIPRDVAQDPRFQPIIDALVSGKLQAFNDGTNEVRPSSIFGPNAKQYEKKVYVGGPSENDLRSSMGQVTDLVNKKPRKETDAQFAARSAKLLEQMQAREARLSEVESAIAKQVNAEVAFSHITGDKSGRVEKRTISQLYNSGNFNESGKKILKAYIDAGMGNTPANAYTSLGFDIPKDLNAGLAKQRGIPRQAYIDAISKPGAINTMVQMLMKDGLSESKALQEADSFRKGFIEQASTLGPNVRDGDLVAKTKDMLASNKYPNITPLSNLNVATRPTAGDIGNFLKKNAATAEVLNYEDADKVLKNQNLSLGPKLGPKLQQDNANITIYKDSSGKIVGVEARSGSKNAISHRGANLPGVGLDMVRTKGGGRFGGYADISSRIKRVSELNEAFKAKQIAVKKGEKIQTQDDRLKTVTGQTGTAKPSNVKTKNTSDKRVISTQGVKRVIPTGRSGIRFMAGAADGIDLTGKTGTTVGAVAGSQQLSQAQIRAALEKTSVKEAKRRIKAEGKLGTALETQAKETELNNKKTKQFGTKLTTGINVLSGLSIAASFAGGQVGEMAQKITPFVIMLSTISMLAPGLKSGFLKLSGFLLANPIFAAVAAVGLVVAGMKILDARNKKLAEAQSDYIDQISATTGQMKSIGQLTGKVGASELMARRREGGIADSFGTNFERDSQQFGTTFLSSEVGKSLYENFRTNLEKGGKDAVKQIGLQLSAYVSDGIISAEQANSVARSIGISMSDMTIAANISGELRKIIGPNGEDLARDPLKVRLEIIKTQTGTFDDVLDTFTKTMDSGIRKELSASLAALGVQSLEINQSQRDAQAKLYDDQVRALQTQLLATTDKQKQVSLEGQIADLKAKQASDDSQFATQRQKALADQIKGYETARKFSSTQKAFFNSLNRQVSNQFKGDALVSSFLDSAAKTNNQELEVSIKTVVAAGALTPRSGIKLLEMFGKGKEEKLNTLLQTTFATQDPGNVQELINIAASLGDKELGLKIITEITAPGGEEEFVDKLKALDLLQELDGKEVNVGLFLKGDKNALNKLVPKLKTIDALKGPITLEVIQKLDKENDGLDLKDFIADYKEYENLPDEVKKKAIASFVTIQQTLGPNEKGQAAGLNRDIFPNLSAPVGPIVPAKTDGNVDKKDRDKTFDDILTNLKRTRDASINAAGGAKELMRVLGGNKDLKFFKGIDQQLSAIGANTGFIDFVGGAEKAIQSKLIKVNKKGVASLTELGEAAKKAYDAKQLGYFSAQSAETIKQLQGQRRGFVALKAAGASSADALKMVEDADFAVSLSKAKTSVQIKKLIKDYQNERKEIEKTLRATDPQGFLKNQMDVVEQKLDLDERIARRQYERETQAAENQIDINNRLIREAERTLEVDEKIGDRKIEIINDQINALQRRISVEIESQQNALDEESRQLSEDNAIISNAVDAINKKYDEQEKALSKIYEINQDIVEQQKEKVGLADAITQGDISAAAQAAQEIRARNAARSGELAQEMLSRARESEVAGVRGSLTGKTSEQIAARQYQIERLSFALSTSRLGIEKNIALKQEEIYEIEVKRKDLYEFIRKTQDNSYDQNLIIQKAQEALDKELAIVKVQRDRLTDLQLGIDKSTQEGAKFTAELNAAYGVIDKVSGLWNGLNDKNLKVTIQTIEDVIRTGSSGGGSFVGTTPISDEQIVANAKVNATVADLEKTASPWLFGGSSTTAAPVGTPFGQAPSAAEVKIAKQIAKWRPGGLAMGGVVPKHFAAGGYARGTDTIPAMLTPGEFVVRKNAVDKFGVNNLNKINDGSATSNSVYNYSVNIDVADTNASSADIARAVIGQIKYIDSQRIRGQR